MAATMDKKGLRALVARDKEGFSRAALLDLSDPVLRRLAAHPRFVAARTVLLYHSLPDEVDTQGFLRYWRLRKRMLLPAVKGKDIELRRYAPGDSLEAGAFGILESTGGVFTDYASIDLAVVPGVAFDARGNRLGRGQGIYDRLLERLRPHGTYTIGICFGFQRVAHVPAEPHDIPVDEVL